MSLKTNLENFATRVSTEVKSIRTLVNGNTADLNGLTTTAKANLVAAINEVKTTADNAATSGGADFLDELGDVAITTPANGHVLRHDGSGFVNVMGSTYFDIAGAAATAESNAKSASQPVDSDLTAIAALTTTAFGRALLTLADSTALTGQVSNASTTVKGVVELATNTEASAGTDTARAVTPSGLASAISGKADTSSLAAVALSGSAADLTGTLPTSVLPALAVNDTFVVASQAAMLALTAQRGDMAIRTDDGKTYVLATDSPGTLADWKEVMAAGAVQSVNGQVGVVVLAKADVGLGNVDNTSDVNKPVSTATQTALNGKVSTTGNETIGGTKTFTSAPAVPDNSWTISDTNGLQGALDGKANTSHSHTLTDLPDAWVKRSVRVATTANITLSGTQTIDAVAVVAGDRVLVKNQTTASGNGIYTVAAGAWIRATDADTAADIAGATVNVDAGGQKGKMFSTTFASTDTLGTTAMAWYEVLTSQTSYALASHNHAGVYEPAFAAGTTLQYRRGDKTWATLDKAAVGLGNVDNTSDAAKPVSTAQQTALNGKQPLDATLTALAGTTVAADQVIYSTGADTFSVTALTAFARTLLDDGTASAARTTLDVYSKAEVYNKTEIGDPETDLVAVFNAGLV